jgi:hypothetical protein
MHPASEVRTREGGGVDSIPTTPATMVSLLQQLRRDEGDRADSGS